MTTELTNEQIWERRFNAAIERFGSFDECMEIPGYGVEPECPPTPIPTKYDNLEKRFEACKQRYQGMEEFMEIPDMDLWLQLKNEIIPKKPLPKLERHVCQTFYTLKEIQDNMVCDDYPSDFDHNQTVSMVMNSSDYVDYYDSDYDNYSMDTIDKEERRYLRFKDEWLENDRDY